MVLDVMNGKRMFGTVSFKKSGKVCEVEILSFYLFWCQTYALILQEDGHLDYCPVFCINNVRSEMIEEN